MHRLYLPLLVLLLFLAGCAEAAATQTLPTKPPPPDLKPSFTPREAELAVQPVQEDLVFQQETAPEPDWIPEVSGGGQPWFQDLYISSSQDGLTFEPGRLFIPHAGVAHLTITQDQILVATFQYFSYTHPELFDRISYTTSRDGGKTWSPVKPLQIDLPGAGPTPVDPTLVQLEDGSFRLYFTYHKHGLEFPQLFTARSDSLTGIFDWEGQALETEQLILDPAVVYFQDTWHHYTTSHQSGEEELFQNVHSTSSDGVTFIRKDDIPSEISFLGDVLVVNDQLRFYSGRRSALSTDGFSWEIEPGERGLGPDPGVVQLSDGSFLAVYTHVHPK